MDRTLAKYYLYRFGGALASRTPPRLGLPLAAWLGIVIWRLHDSARGVIEENLSHILGPDPDPDQVRDTGRRVFQNSVKSYYHLFRRTASPAAIRGVGHVRESLLKGKGVILTSAHFGNFDALWSAAASYGYPLTVPVERVRPERLFQHLLRLRSADGVRLIPVDGPLVSVRRALKRNEIVCLAADRDITQSGTTVELFGARAHLPDGAVRLAMRTGAPLLFGYGLHNGGSHQARVLPPLALRDTGDPDSDLRANHRTMARTLEAVISRHPDQWLMFTPLWRVDSPRGDG
ncbi:MAG: lysophospholipid acyltransferase family protein [Anaerolineae bacterium]